MLCKNTIMTEKQKKTPLVWTQKMRDDVLHRRDSGESLKFIGEGYGLSPERIRQVEAQSIRMKKQKDLDNQTPQPQDVHVDSLGLTYRVNFALRQAKIYTAFSAAKLSKEEMLKILGR